MKNFLINEVFAEDVLDPRNTGVTPPNGSEPRNTLPVGGDSFPNPLGDINTIPDLINLILGIVMRIGIPIIALMIMYAGFLYVTARGNETQLTKAHTAIKYTLIGAAIILGAFVISNAITGTINQFGTQ